MPRKPESNRTAPSHRAPGGYFSDSWEGFEMCPSGVFLCLDNGEIRFNPISLRDLGQFVASRFLDNQTVISHCRIAKARKMAAAKLCPLIAKTSSKPISASVLLCESRDATWKNSRVSASPLDLTCWRASTASWKTRVTRIDPKPFAI